MSKKLEPDGVKFAVDFKKGTDARYYLTWPKDQYYGLVESPVLVVQMEANHLSNIARRDDSSFPEATRLAFAMHWLTEAARGVRLDWPSLPILTRRGETFAFIDGRHRCEALEALEVDWIPVIIA